MSTPTVGPLASAGDDGAESDDPKSGDQLSAIVNEVKESQKGISPISKTKTLTVPGYKGLLGIEYRFIDTEVTESIAREVNRETKHNNGVGAGLLSSIDTLVRGCKRVMVRGDARSKEWMSIGGDRMIHLDHELAAILGFQASDSRDVVLALFGSEHAIINQNLIYSRWLADTESTQAEDFLG